MKLNLITIFGLLLFNFLFCFQNLKAQEKPNSEKKDKPLWEAGVGLVYAIAPDYPGANHSSYYSIPFPTFLYRGKVIRADEDGGMRGRFIKKENYEFNISFGGALPSKSENNATRIGMEDLDTMVEIGPAFVLKIFKTKKSTLKFTVPLRIALTTDFTGFDERGLVFNPLLSYVKRDLLGEHTYIFTALSTRFATQKLHRYFYQVDPEFATAVRPTYRASGGYLSTSLSLGFSKTFDNDKTIFIGARHSLLQGAANYESPLLVAKANTSFALGFIWWAFESSIKGYQ